MDFNTAMMTMWMTGAMYTFGYIVPHAQDRTHWWGGPVLALLSFIAWPYFLGAKHDQ